MLATRFRFESEALKLASMLVVTCVTLVPSTSIEYCVANTASATGLGASYQSVILYP